MYFLIEALGNKYTRQKKLSEIEWYYNIIIKGSIHQEDITIIKFMQLTEEFQNTGGKNRHNYRKKSTMP